MSMASSDIENMSRDLDKPNIIGQSINDSLNDDCLIEIFQNLSNADRIRIELVCKRWNASSKLSWSNVHFLDTNTENFYADGFSSIEEKTNFIIKCVKRCCNYLNKIIIKDDPYLSSLLILNEILIHCENLEDFTIIVKKKEKNNFHGILKSIFKKNVKLQNVRLRNLNLEGDCFSSLLPNKIKQLYVEWCSIKNVSCFYDLLSKVKNLTNLKIFGYQYSVTSNINFMPVVSALLESECENLIEFSINLSYEPAVMTIVSNFLKRQKNLCFLDLDEFYVNQAVTESISAESLKTLNIGLADGMQFENINRFRNLKSVYLELYELTDKFTRSLSECLNIKNIHVSMCDYLLTTVGEDSLKNLHKLTRFSLLLHFVTENGEACKDNLIKALRECKSLKVLNLSGFNFTKEGLSHISFFPNLETLNISYSKFSDNDLVDLVNKSLNLKEIYIEACTNVTDNFVIKVNDLKTKRGDTDVLKVHCYAVEALYEFDGTDLPLILLNKVEYDPWELFYSPDFFRHKSA